MATRKLTKNEWAKFFDQYSKRVLMNHDGHYADLQLLSGLSGNVKETDWLKLQGITYDEKGDLLEILLEDLDHMITHPDQIFIDENPQGDIVSMQIVEKDGTKHILEAK